MRKQDENKEIEANLTQGLDASVKYSSETTDDITQPFVQGELEVCVEEPVVNQAESLNEVNDVKTTNTEQNVQISLHTEQRNSSEPAHDKTNPQDVPIEVIMKDFNKIRTFMKISGICGPISLIFGGVLLGAVALIFGILAFKKVTPYSEWDNEFGDKARRVKKFSMYAIIICLICIIINIIFIALYAPEYLAYFSSGGSTTATSTSSTWG